MQVVMKLSDTENYTRSLFSNEKLEQHAISPPSIFFFDG